MNLAPLIAPHLLPTVDLHYTIHLDGIPFLVKFGAIYKYSEYVGVLQEEFMDNKLCYKFRTVHFDRYLFYNKETGNYIGSKPCDSYRL